MIEIKTQAQFNSLATTIANTPTTGELIRIYPKEDGTPYTVASAIKIQRSNIFIEGIDMPVIQSTITGNTVEVDHSVISVLGTANTLAESLENITIRGLHIKGNKANTGGSCGIYCEYVGFAYSTGLTSGDGSRYDSFTVGSTYKNKKGIIVKDCVIEDNNIDGIYLNHSSNNTVLGNTVQNNDACGIFLDDSSNNSISGNILQNNSNNGIYVDASSNNSISGNTIQNNNWGIDTYLSFNNTVSNNKMQNNECEGLYLNYSSNNTISGNISQNNGSYGFCVDASSNNTISGNTVQNNDASGIISDDPSSNNVISGNTVQNNKDGICLYFPSNNTIISGNTIQNNNTVGIYVNGDYNNMFSNILLENVTANLNIEGGTGNIGDGTSNIIA